MIILDPAKIEAIRDVFDSDVAELAISENCSRDMAYELLAIREFETSILPSINLYTGWWHVTLIEGSANYAFHGPEERVATGYMTASEAAKWKLQSTIFARNPEVLALGALSLLLNPDAEVKMDQPDFRKFYGDHALFEIADTLGSCSGHDDSDAQPTLFLQNFDERLRIASSAICRATRPLVNAWVRVVS